MSEYGDYFQDGKPDVPTVEDIEVERIEEEVDEPIKPQG